LILSKDADISCRLISLFEINFSGGEPFLHPEHLGKMVEYCKRDLALESVSIVTNGSLIRDSWFERYGAFLDILAVSCDSFEEETNRLIGRHRRASDPLGGGRAGSQREIVEHISNLCQQYEVFGRSQRA
jgi:radical S-adenosyl methionine domain-containing protein 2